MLISIMITWFKVNFSFFNGLLYERNGKSHHNAIFYVKSNFDNDEYQCDTCCRKQKCTPVTSRKNGDEQLTR